MGEEFSIRIAKLTPARRAWFERAVARSATGGELVAYVVARPEARLDPGALRAHVAARAPAYLVPSAFVVLDALPVTASGKLDRQALPKAGAAGAAGAPAYEGPRTELEAALARIWAEVLRLERVGVGDDFFSLGG
ncbi:MAG TPA: hypothetical protein VFS00_33210, partial [Polyangiaceae bacterium]|nr:hypothetical protein [Polyangiaceae bacterium]